MRRNRSADRDSSGRFSGVRFNVESVPRLPTFTARWLLADPRRRPYLVFWTTRDGYLAYALRVEAVDGGEAAQLTDDKGRNTRVALLRRPLPVRGGVAILYQCPVCRRACRYLYTHVFAYGRLVDHLGWQCQACAGLRWRSQGHYRRVFTRRAYAMASAFLGLTKPSEPLPRHPWDPRAVSDPRLVVDEFPNLRQAERQAANQPGGSR